MSLIDKQLSGETPRAGTMAHGITGAGIARPVLVNDDGTVNVTGGGGGTEYTEGNAAPADPVGPTILFENGSGDWQNVGVGGGFGEPLPVTATITSIAAGSNNIGNVDIDTVPAPLNVTGGGTEAAALRVTIASDSTGVLSVDDNGGSLTVDGTVAATQSGTWTVQPGNTANTTPWLTSSKSALTASSPTAATVGTSSAQVVASNASRKGLVLTNTSNNTISFGIGAAAVLNSGVTLTPGGTWVMDEFTFATGAINAIASAVTSNLAIQELT